MLDDISAEAARQCLLDAALVLQLDTSARVVDANSQARRLLGNEIIGCPLAEQLADTLDEPELAGLIAHLRDGLNGVHSLTLTGVSGVPETLRFRFFPLASGTLAIGSLDLCETSLLYAQPSEVGRDANGLNQQLHQANAELRALHANNSLLAKERERHEEILRQQSLASLNLMEDAIQAHERMEKSYVALLASEARGRAIFNGAPEAAFIVYPGGRCLDLNAVTVPRYGYSREEFLAMAPAGLVAPELRLEFAEQLERAKQGAVRFESRHLRKDGSEFPVDMSVSPVELDGEDCLLCTARDSSERKEAEEALRRSELRYGSILEGAPDPVVVIDQSANVILFNAEAERLFGYARAEILGQPVDRIIPFHLRESLAAPAAGRGAVGREGHAVRKDGVEIPIELRLSPAPAEAGAGGAQTMLAIRDLSGIKSAEAKFQKLLEAAPDAIVVANGEGRMVLVNTQAEKMFGRPREALLEENIDVLFPERLRHEVAGQRAAYIADFLTNSGRAGLLPSALPAFTEETPSPLAAAELSGSRPDGGEFPIEVSLSALKIEEGVLLFNAIRDVSERTKTQLRSRLLEIVSAEAQAANKAKSMFISTMSHEIRTPMNAILGYSQLMLRDTNLGAEAKTNLKIINRSGEHLLHMINDILDLAKIEAGHAHVKPRVFGLPGLLRDLEAMFRLRAEAKALQLVVSIHGEPLQYITADDGKIRQVLINLLGNAVKFTDRGRITVQVSLEFRGGNNLWLSARVEDTGCGMTREEQDSLFQPFIQGHAGQRMRDGGSGLGLAIGQKVAHLMNGAISATSKLGEGSTFIFEMPVQRARERDFLRHSGPGKRVIGLAPGQARPRVLIVDDRADNREWLSKLLATLGFSARSADNGEAAISISEEWHPQLILMDMHMPVMNGLEATRRIKSSPSGSDTIIIALTADAMDDYRRFVLKNEVNDFITKPCTEDHLLEKIRKHLGLVYIYEDEMSLREMDPADAREQEALSLAKLRALPEDLVRQIRQATLGGDKARLDELILMTEERTDKETVRAFQELANDYQYDKLIQLLESAWPN